ncbi:MAG TPA: M20/M25/M40 family metallo-hydrolase [Solirubrobacteraceae bacterium]|nr:M20/M25/M40 family metallo-hydrolase [Solirubrobacteraceae bacterium]
MDERALAERLITYDTSTADGIRAAAGFVKGWLESAEVEVSTLDFHDLPVLTAAVGDGGPTIILHGHIDVVPGFAEQFVPRVEGDRLIGRGAYDMKGGLAAIMCALADLRDLRGARVRFVCAPDEESENFDQHSTDDLVARGLTGDFAITGEPTDLHVGVQAKGVLMVRMVVRGRAAHGSTPWLGDNAILKALDVFRRIETMPFALESSEMFDRPSINLGRLNAGDAVNKVPDEAVMAVDIRFLPGQEPGAILEQIRAMPDVEVVKTFIRPPAYVSRQNSYVVALCEAVRRAGQQEAMSVGRDGASDAISFIEAGVPAVEFGPVGGGHHGPEEWVSVSSLARYRRALVDFVRRVPEMAGQPAEASLRALEGGRA